MDCVYIIRDETTEEAAMKQLKKQQKVEEKKDEISYFHLFCNKHCNLYK